MLCAVSGPQSCGKSTVLNTLRDMGYPVIARKTSRSILADWGVTLSQVNNDRDLTVPFQQEILKRKIADEQQAASSSDIWFTERTFADLHVYNVVSLGKDNDYSSFIDHYYDDCVVAQRTYSHIFYITGGHFAPVHDGVRGSNQHYNKMVDLFMRSCTEQMSGNDLTIIDTPSPEDRIIQIQTVLAQKQYGETNDRKYQTKI